MCEQTAEKKLLLLVCVHWCLLSVCAAGEQHCPAGSDLKHTHTLLQVHTSTVLITITVVQCFRRGDQVSPLYYQPLKLHYWLNFSDRKRSPALSGDTNQNKSYSLTTVPGLNSINHVLFYESICRSYIYCMLH